MSYKIIGIFFLFFAVSGCHHEQRNMMIGMPNPASVYCVKLGGKSVMMSKPQGQYANCILPNNEVIEEWALYRRDHSHLK